MCNCTVCHSAETPPHICQSCFNARVQPLLDSIEELQQEVITITAKYQLTKFALDLKLGRRKSVTTQSH